MQSFTPEAEAPARAAAEVTWTIRCASAYRFDYNGAADNACAYGACRVQRIWPSGLRLLRLQPFNPWPEDADYKKRAEPSEVIQAVKAAVKQ